MCPFALALPHRAYLGRQVGAKSGPELLNILDLRGGGGGVVSGSEPAPVDMLIFCTLIRIVQAATVYPIVSPFYPLVRPKLFFPTT